MEDQADYGVDDFGKIPKNSRIELAYSLIGVAMGLAGEANAAIAGALKGEKPSDRRVRVYLQNAGTIMRVVEDLVQIETWNYTDARAPF